MPPPCILVGVTSKPFKNWRPLTPVIFEPHGPSSHFKRCEERQWLAILWGFRKSARRRRPRPPAGPMLEVGGASPIPGSRPAARSTTGAAQEPLGRSQSRPRVAQEAICLLAEARGIRMPQAAKQSSQAISPDTIFFESTLFRALDAWVHSCQRYL